MHSLLASVYDWENDVGKRKRHFRKAMRIQGNLPEEKRNLAFCHIYKKANMIFDFKIPEIQARMKQSMEGYQKLHLYRDAWECAHNIGLSYMFLCDFEEAYYYLQKSIDGFHNLKSREIYVPLNSIGILHMLKGDFETAHGYFKRINTDVIEPFCAYSVLINKSLCEIRLHKKTSIILDTFSLLDDLEKTEGMNMELRLPYVNLQIAKAFFALHKDKIKESSEYFVKAILQCDEKNDNFALPGVICAKMLKAQIGNDIPSKANLYISANNELGELCQKLQIIVCDFLFWK